MAPDVLLHPSPAQGDDLRAVDKMMIAYLCATGLVLVWFRQAIPSWEWRLAGHAAGILAIVVSAKGAWLPARIFHEWYPVACIGECYGEMCVFIASLRGTVTFDAELARLDEIFFPAVWSCVRALSHPWITEIRQIVYTSFLAGLVLVLVQLRRKRPGAPFHYCAFLLSLGFLTSFVGYFLVPAYGPREFVPGAHSIALSGVWTFDALRAVLDSVEGRYPDCFPSGHAEMIILAWWCSRQLSRRFFAGYTFYSACIIASTVCLSYHYVIDLAAGAALAGALIAIGPGLFRWCAAPHEIGTLEAGK